MGSIRTIPTVLLVLNLDPVLFQLNLHLLQVFQPLGTDCVCGQPKPLGSFHMNYSSVHSPQFITYMFNDLPLFSIQVIYIPSNVKKLKVALKQQYPEITLTFLILIRINYFLQKYQHVWFSLLLMFVSLFVSDFIISPAPEFPHTHSRKPQSKTDFHPTTTHLPRLVCNHCPAVTVPTMVQTSTHAVISQNLSHLPHLSFWKTLFILQDTAQILPPL